MNGKPSECDLENGIDEEEMKKYKLFLNIKEKSDINQKENKKEEDKENFYIYKVNDKYYYALKGEDTITYYANSRFISFINDEENFNKKFFIHDQISLDSALNKAKIKEALLISNETEKKNFNSNDSKESINSSKSSKSLDIEDILREGIISIKQEKSIKVANILSKQNFDQRFSFKNVYEMDLNFKYYKDFYSKNYPIDFDIFNKKWLGEIENFYTSNKFNSELLVIGPKGVGKTTNIIAITKLAKIPRLYFPIKKLSNFNIRKLKKIALYEAIYIFQTEKDIEEFKKIIDKIPDSPNLILFIFEYIKLILEFYKKLNRRKKILIILDDYDNSLDPNNDILNIEEYIHNNRGKLLLCLLGNCPYIYKRYFNYIMNKNQNYEATYWDLPLKDEEKKDLLNLPLYFYRHKYMQNNDKTNNKNNQSDLDFKQLIKEELINDFKKIKLKYFILSSKYLNYYSFINDFVNEFEYLPLEFLVIEKRNENNKIEIKLSFKLEIYKEVFDESIKGLLKIVNIKSTFILKNDEEYYNKDGIEFEDIIVEQLWNNVLELENFSEKNKIKVYDIYSIKSYNGERYTIEKNKPIIIRQTKFSGKYYDLLLILGNEGERIGIFIQIGLSKDKFDICKYYNNLYNNSQQYLDGIELLIDEKIQYLGFILIFDHDKQSLLKKNNNTSEGVGYCESENYAYLIYKDFKLFKDLDSKDPIVSLNLDNCKVLSEKEFEGKDIFIMNYKDLCNDLIKKKYSPNIFINDKQKTNIIEYINKRYNKNFSDLIFVTNMGEKIKGVLEYGFFDEIIDQINILNGVNCKFIKYNSELLKINPNSEKIEIAKEKEKNFVTTHTSSWDLYLLDKKRKRGTK